MIEDAFAQKPLDEATAIEVISKQVTAPCNHPIQDRLYNRGDQQVTAPCNHPIYCYWPVTAPLSRRRWQFGTRWPAPHACAELRADDGRHGRVVDTRAQRRRPSPYVWNVTCTMRSASCVRLPCRIDPRDVMLLLPGRYLPAC